MVPVKPEKQPVIPQRSAPCGDAVQLHLLKLTWNEDGSQNFPPNVEHMSKPM